MDKIYLTPDEQNIYFLDVTRISGSNKIVARGNESIADQIKRLGKSLNGQNIILADDVVFSGSVLKNIIEQFKKVGVKVIGIISAISTNAGYQYFNNNLKYGLKANYLLADDVIDQICERDFYFGIAGSGIIIDTPNGYFKAPYFKPYGDPYNRASIPKEYENYFSQGCLERSLYLWQEIDLLKKESTLIKDLPERIVNTKGNESVCLTLRSEIKKCK